MAPQTASGTTNVDTGSRTAATDLERVSIHTSACSAPFRSRRVAGSAFRSRLRGVAQAALRHGQSAVGPLGISGAHFFAAIALLHYLPSAEFGQFSFVIVVAGFCLGITNGLLGAPISSMARLLAVVHNAELNDCLKFCVALAICLGSAVFAIMLLSGVPAGPAALFGIYGASMSLRLVARTYAYTTTRVRRVILSDCIYSVCLVIGLTGLLATHHIDLATIALVMALGAILALFPFDFFFSRLLDGLQGVSTTGYGRIWHDMSRWSLLGVVTTELTINAHAYLVTFICGSKAFALLAVGSLFMRPFSLLAAALPDQERPAMARSIAAGDALRALKIAREFRTVIGAIWVATIIFAATVLIWFPTLVIRKGYDKNDVIVVVVLWGLITAVRGIRAADAVLLQAAREFRPLADAGTKSCVVAMAATLILLLIGGPVASLGGILIGDVVMLAVIMKAVHAWKLNRA